MSGKLANIDVLVQHVANMLPTFPTKLADIAINLHKSSKYKVPNSCKDFVDTATTAASSAGAATFTAFLALVLFVLCLTAIIVLAEEYESFFSCTEEDKGNCLRPMWPSGYPDA